MVDYYSTSKALFPSFFGEGIDQGWADLQTIVRVQRERRLTDHIEIETAFYIRSLAATVEPLLMATRYHWAVENSLHWVLDVIFR